MGGRDNGNHRLERRVLLSKKNSSHFYIIYLSEYIRRKVNIE